MNRINSQALTRALLVWFGLTALAAVLYFNHLRHNPPGFFIDESSVAYNAHTISQTGKDEHGVAWPLFFRAFGEFKNPVYVYMLAALFRLTGPSILVARCLSATTGLATVALLGLLAARMSRRLTGFLVAITALLTPWLFELSRVVIEVTLYPLALTLFLLCVWRASIRSKWTLSDVLGLAAALALLTYTYSIGRLLAPLLALGLIWFVTRARVRALLLTWFAYALTLVPMLVFQERNPQALTGRFGMITYLSPQRSPLRIGEDFLKHFVANLNPWKLFITEQSKVNELLHIPGAPAMLTITAALAVAGIFLITRREIDAWWRFILFGLFASVAPASLTNDYFHMLRLCAVPVFIIVLSIPAFAWLAEGRTRGRRITLVVTLLLIVVQGSFFQGQFQASARWPRRLHTFDADYPRMILPAALANAPSASIYLADNSSRPGYIQAYWYGTLQKISLQKFVSLGFDQPAPEGAVVITTESIRPRCRVLVESEPYTTCIAQGPPRFLTRLPDDAFAAELSVPEPLPRLRSEQPATILVVVKNASKVMWPARERSGEPFQLHVGNHWLDAPGNVVVHDDGRGALPRDLRPGETTAVPLTINAPQHSGDYLLEIDMLQEGVSWFALRGSRTLRLPIKVE